MQISHKLLAFVVFLWLHSLASGQTGSGSPPFASDMPPEVAFCVWSDDPRVLAERWQETPIFQLYASAAMRPFWEDVRRKQGAVLPTQRLGLEWEDLAAVAAGNWVLAYDAATDSPGTFLIVDVTGREDDATLVLGRVQQRWRDQGLMVSTEARSWGSVFAGKREGTNRFAFLRGSRLHLTDQRRLVEHLLASGGSTSKSPSSTADIRTPRRIVAEPAPPGALQFLVHPWRLARAAAENDSSKMARQVAFFERHGASAIQAISGHVVFQKGPDAAEFSVVIPVRFPLKEAAALLSFIESRDFMLPPLVPVGAVAVQCFHWNVRRAFQAYGFLYDDVYGEGYLGAFDDLLGSLAEDPEGPRVDLRAELIDLLDTKVTRAYDFGGARTGTNPSGRRELWMARSTDPERSARAIEQFFDGDPDVSSTLVQDVRIWHSRLPEPWLGTDPDNPLSIPIDAVCILQSHLVLATDRQILQDLAGPDKAPAREAGKFWDASSPQPRITQGWRDLAEIGRNSHSLLAENQPPGSGSWEQMLLWLLLSRETEHGRIWDIDGSRLPPFSAIEQHFGIERIEVSALRDGWRLQGRISYPSP